MFSEAHPPQLVRAGYDSLQDLLHPPCAPALPLPELGHAGLGKSPLPPLQALREEHKQLLQRARLLSAKRVHLCGGLKNDAGLTTALKYPGSPSRACPVKNWGEWLNKRANLAYSIQILLSGVKGCFYTDTGRNTILSHACSILYSIIIAGCHSTKFFHQFTVLCCLLHHTPDMVVCTVRLHCLKDTF